MGHERFRGVRVGPAVLAIALAGIGVDRAAAVSGPSSSARVVADEQATTQVVPAPGPRRAHLKLEDSLKSAVMAFAAERPNRQPARKAGRRWGRWTLTADPRQWPPRFLANPWDCTPGFNPLTRRHWWP